MCSTNPQTSAIDAAVTQKAGYLCSRRSASAWWMSERPARIGCHPAGLGVCRRDSAYLAVGPASPCGLRSTERNRLGFLRRLESIRGEYRCDVEQRALPQTIHRHRPGQRRHHISQQPCFQDVLLPSRVAALSSPTTAPARPLSQEDGEYIPKLRRPNRSLLAGTTGRSRTRKQGKQSSIPRGYCRVRSVL